MINPSSDYLLQDLALVIIVFIVVLAITATGKKRGAK